MLAYRRAAQRIGETGGSIAQLALDGKAQGAPGDRQDDRGEDRPDRRAGRDRGARRSGASGSRPTWSRSCGCPGSAPKTARRIWLELGVTTLDGLREAAEQQRLRTLTGLGPKVEENVLKALKEQLEAEGAGAAAARRRACRRCSPRSRRSAPIRRPSRCRRRAACAAGARPFRDLDIIATATDAEALIDALHRLRLGRRGGRARAARRRR